MLKEAYAALLIGNLDHAESIAKTGLTNEVERGPAFSILAVVSLRRGDPDESLKWAEQALALGQDDVMTLSNAGEAYRRLGNLEKAADHFERALKIDNLNASLHFNMALVMRQMGNAPLAEHFFRSAQIADPEMWQAYSNLAELYRDEGHLSEAEAEYRNAIRSNPDEAKPMERLGNLLLEIGHPKGAVDLLETANRLTGGTAESMPDLAKAYFELCYESSACAVLSDALARFSQPSDSPHFRVEAARRESFESMRTTSTGAFGVLAKERRLNVPLPKTLPEEESVNFILGIPHAPEIFWARMRDVRVLPKEFSVIAGGNSLYVDAIVNWAQFYRQRGAYVVHESDDMRVLLKTPKQIRSVEETCALLGGSGDGFSWMYECIPRLWTIEQLPGFQQIKLIVPEDLSAERVEMLRRFGVGPDRLIRQSSAECILARDLLVPSLLAVGDWVSPIALQYLRRGLSQSGGSPPFRRIFIFRNSGGEQRLRNVEEVGARLLLEGFESIDMTSLAMSEKVKMLSEAAVIIGMDDDDLALIPVLSQGAWVGAMAPRGRYHPRAHLVSAQLGIKLVYLFGDPDFSGGRALEQCDVVMSMSVMDQFLSLIFPIP